MTTVLLLVALHRQWHGLLKLTRHFIMVSLIVMILVGVNTPTLVLSLVAQAALLVVTRNVGQAPGGEDHAPMTFFQAIFADKIHFGICLAWLVGLFFYLLPYEPDFVTRNGDDDFEPKDDDEEWQRIAELGLISDAWIFAYIALALIVTAI